MDAEPEIAGRRFVTSPLRVALLPGDGIGPEVVAQARRVLEAAVDAGLADLELEPFPHGADHHLRTGESLGEETFERLRDEFDAILLGALGDPRVEDGVHAREILLGLRFRLDLYVNYRPAVLRAPDLCPLRSAPEALAIHLFRENTEGLYVGAGGRIREGTSRELALAEAVATRRGVERIVRAAFEFAESRGQGRVTLADKANAVPQLYGLWRDVFRDVAGEYPGIEAEARYADAVAMALVRDPGQFEVVVSDNLLGDLLSDLTSELTGGLGIAASANRHPGRHALYEPVHGSAPDIAGTGTANPMAAILSAALMLGDGGFAEAADRIEGAVDAALAEGVRTPDVGGDASTAEVGEWIAGRVGERD